MKYDPIMRECKVNVKKNVDTSEEIAGTEEAKESHERIRSDVSIVAARENEWTCCKRRRRGLVKRRSYLL